MEYFSYIYTVLITINIMRKILSIASFLFVYIGLYIYFRELFADLTGLPPEYAIIPYLISWSFIPWLVKKLYFN